MEVDDFTDEEFFRVLSQSGARALLIGRRALVLLGAPVVTAEYELWLHFDDVEPLNAAFEPLGHSPSRTPDAARAAGRYVIENGERIDVMIAQAKGSPTTLGEVPLEFDAAWARRRSVAIAEGITVAIPSLDDLITIKRWGLRPKDLIDIQFLEALRR